MWALLLVGGLAIGDHEPSRLAAQEAITRISIEPIGRIRIGMTINEVNRILNELPMVCCRLDIANQPIRNYLENNIKIAYSKSFKVIGVQRLR